MKHLVFDTETTDLIFHSGRSLSKQPYIFEIAGVIWEDADDTIVLRHWQVDPCSPISKTSTKKTGVTDAMVRGRPPFASVAPEVRRMVEDAGCVIAHNLSFDKAMVDNEFLRIGATVAWPQRRVCTIEHTEHLLGYRLSLEHLHRFLFNEDFEKKHSAEADAQATMRCYRELINRGEIKR